MSIGKGLTRKLLRSIGLPRMVAAAGNSGLRTISGEDTVPLSKITWNSISCRSDQDGALASVCYFHVARSACSCIGVPAEIVLALYVLWKHTCSLLGLLTSKRALTLNEPLLTGPSSRTCRKCCQYLHVSSAATALSGRCNCLLPDQTDRCQNRQNMTVGMCYLILEGLHGGINNLSDVSHPGQGEL